MKKHIIAALLITALVGVAADTAKPNKAPVKVSVEDSLKKEVQDLKEENKILKQLLAKAEKEIQRLGPHGLRNTPRANLGLKGSKHRAAYMKFFDKNENGKLEWPSEIGTRFGPTTKQMKEFTKGYNLSLRHGK